MTKEWTLSEYGLADDFCLAQPRAARWLGAPPEEQERLGYVHTLREILQQPATWLDTAHRASQMMPALRELVNGSRAVVLTGSGSSLYAGECVRSTIEKELKAVTVTAGGGELLTDLQGKLPPARPALMVSLARSGNSPESVGALEAVREREPDVRHLVVTSNPRGRLAEVAEDHRILVLALDDRTNDRSLVMTGSFTNLALAVRCLGLPAAPERYARICRRLSEMCRAMFCTSFDALAEVAELGFDRAVFLGSGAGFGAARESALKMLEMTAGRVATMSETYLGFRHGPMSFAHANTLIVCFLSSDAVRRGYETDLVRELRRKRLGRTMALVGESIPPGLIRVEDLAVELPGLSEIGDDDAPLLYAVVGQVLAFSRCLKEGLRPDSPSENGIISRVVESFPLYTAGKA